MAKESTLVEWKVNKSINKSIISKTKFLIDISKSVLNYELSLARLDSLRDLYMYRLKHLMCIIQG